MIFLWSLWCRIDLKKKRNDFKLLPCELWLRRSDARVSRELLRVREPSGASPCSRSVEKSESSVPSELLPAVLCKTTTTTTTINTVSYTVCHQQIKRARFFFTSGKFSKDPMLGKEHHCLVNK